MLSWCRECMTVNVTGGGSIGIRGVGVNYYILVDIHFLRSGTKAKRSVEFLLLI